MPEKPSRSVELKDRIRQSGLRGTSSRAAVLECLIDAGGPLTHAEVCEQIASAGLDRATVWRNLNDLTEARLLRRTDHGDHLWRFEVAQENEHPLDTVHPHFVCTACGSISCLPEGVVTIEASRNAPRALRSGAYEVQVRGTCNDCG